MNLKKELDGVANAVAKVMEAELSPKQKQIAKLAEPKHKIDAGDLAKLRAGHKPVKEHSDDDTDKYNTDESAGPKYGVKKMKKEEVQQIQEYESKGGVYKHKGTYGTAKGVEYGETDYDKENEMVKNLSKPAKPARKKYGARQNYVRSSRVNESFSGLLSVYKEQGLKGLAEAMIKEEPTEDEFNKELADQKASMEGKKKQPKISTPSTQGVKTMPEEIEVLDANKVNGVQIDTIEEREMTEPEMKKREEIVKSMKKGMAGFKERYGERAKNVMYATATKQAMKD